MGYLKSPLVTLRTLLSERPALQELLGVETAAHAALRIHYREATDDGSMPQPRLIIGVEDGLSVVLDASTHVDNLRLWVMLELVPPDAFHDDVAQQEDWIVGKLDTLLEQLRDELLKRESLSVASIQVAQDPYLTRPEMAAVAPGQPVMRDLWFTQFTIEVR